MAYTAHYNATDLGNMAIDVAGAFLNALATNAGAIGVLIVIGFIVVIVSDLIWGIFGIFKR